MRIRATTEGVVIELTAKEKRELNAGREVARLLAKHADSKDAIEAAASLSVLIDKYCIEDSAGSKEADDKSDNDTDSSDGAADEDGGDATTVVDKKETVGI